MSIQDVAKFLRSEEWLYMEQGRLFNAKRMAVMAEACERFAWRPIETAPKDGEEFLCFDSTFKDFGIGWWAFEWRWPIAFDNKGDEFVPTHWMPLPEPPESN